MRPRNQKIAIVLTAALSLMVMAFQNCTMSTFNSALDLKRESEFSSVTSASGLLLSTSQLQALRPMERVGVSTQNGIAQFYLKSSGEIFSPRGINFTRLTRLNSNGDSSHSTFDPGYYETIKDTEVENALRIASESGYNYVRVFLAYDSFGMKEPGVHPGYLSNLADFIARSNRHNLYVVLTGSWAPANYDSLVYSVPFPDNVEGPNYVYFHLGQRIAWTQSYIDLLTALRNISPELISTIFAIDIRNENAYDVNLKPFSLESGTVTFEGSTYDMARANDRQELADTTSVRWVNAITQGIKQVDSDILVGASVFSPVAIGRDGFDGVQIRDCDRRGRCDNRYPFRPLKLQMHSMLDFIDLHLYQEAGRAEAKFIREARSMELPLPSQNAKPLLMGEFGAFRHDYSEPAHASEDLRIHLRKSCDYNFVAWGFWTIDTIDGTWGLLEQDGALNKVVAPIHWPQICNQPTTRVRVAPTPPVPPVPPAPPTPPPSPLVTTPSATLLGTTFTWAYGGTHAGTCVSFNEPSEPTAHTWFDNALCTDRDLGIRFSYAGRIAGMDCTSLQEGSDPNSWSDNFVCLPSNVNFGFVFSNSGPLTGQSCVLMAEPNDPHSWSDNYLCMIPKVSYQSMASLARSQGSLTLTWSMAGPVPGQVCTLVNETSDPHAWSDNYMCSNIGIGLQFSMSGPIAGKNCVPMNEPSDPHTWHDNYICVDHSANLRIEFSYNGPRSDMTCLKVDEASEPESHTWGDNYFCVAPL